MQPVSAPRGLVAIAEESPGLADEAVLARACESGKPLLSADKDFGELVYRRRLPHAGVLLRLSGLEEDVKCDLVATIPASHGDRLGGAFSVLTPEAIRIRTAPGA